MRLRSACELELVKGEKSIVATRPAEFTLPPADSLGKGSVTLLQKCQRTSQIRRSSSPTPAAGRPTGDDGIGFAPDLPAHEPSTRPLKSASSTEAIRQEAREAYHQRGSHA